MSVRSIVHSISNNPLIQEKDQESSFWKLVFLYVVDKNALKLEKNRESAKRARLRKKLYIKLLENQVEHLRGVSKEG